MKQIRVSMHYPRNNSLTGFTLVELLIVVAIIAMLTSAVSVFYSGTRAKSRDAKREQDMKTLSNALSLYAASNQLYPVYSGYITGSDALTLDLKNSGSIDAVLVDPRNLGDYRYQYNSADGTNYVLTYYLETDSIPGKAPGANTASP